MNIRQAREQDLENIYMMGFDAWSDGHSKEEYLKICRSSKKYANATWYVLENDKDVLLSSLLIHNLNYLNSPKPVEIRGIGSISTPLQLRKHGYASNLVKKTISLINSNVPVNIWFLYSDIGTDFYNKLNFKALPDDLQKYPSTVLMAYSEKLDLSSDFTRLEIPDYF